VANVWDDEATGVGAPAAPKSVWDEVDDGSVGGLSLKTPLKLVQALQAGGVGGTVEGVGGVTRAIEETTGQNLAAGTLKAIGWALSSPKYLGHAFDLLTGNATLNDIVKGPEKELPYDIFGPIKKIFDAASDDIMSREVPGFLDTSISDVEKGLGLEPAFAGKWIGEKGKALTKAMMPELTPGTIEAGMASGFQSMGQMIPLIAASILTKGKFKPLLPMALESGGQDYAEKREAGFDPATSIAAFLTNTFTEYWTEKLPLEALVNPKHSLGKRTLMAALTDAPGEQLATLIESGIINTATTNPKLTWGELLGELKDTAISSVTMAGVMGPSMHPVVKWAEKQENKNWSRDIQKAVELNGHTVLNPDDLISAYSNAVRVQKVLPDDVGLATAMGKMQVEMEKRGIWPTDGLSADIEKELGEIDWTTGSAVALARNNNYKAKTKAEQRLQSQSDEIVRNTQAWLNTGVPGDALKSSPEEILAEIEAVKAKKTEAGNLFTLSPGPSGGFSIWGKKFDEKGELVVDKFVDETTGMTKEVEATQLIRFSPDTAGYDQKTGRFSDEASAKTALDGLISDVAQNKKLTTSDYVAPTVGQAKLGPEAIPMPEKATSAIEGPILSRPGVEATEGTPPTKGRAAVKGIATTLTAPQLGAEVHRRVKDIAKIRGIVTKEMNTAIPMPGVNMAVAVVKPKMASRTDIDKVVDMTMKLLSSGIPQQQAVARAVGEHRQITAGTPPIALHGATERGAKKGFYGVAKVINDASTSMIKLMRGVLGMDKVEIVPASTVPSSSRTRLTQQEGHGSHFLETKQTPEEREKIERVRFSQQEYKRVIGELTDLRQRVNDTYEELAGIMKEADKQKGSDFVSRQSLRELQRAADKLYKTIGPALEQIRKLENIVTPAVARANFLPSGTMVELIKNNFVVKNVKENRYEINPEMVKAIQSIENALQTQPQPLAFAERKALMPKLSEWEDAVAAAKRDGATGKGAEKMAARNLLAPAAQTVTLKSLTGVDFGKTGHPVMTTQGKLSGARIATKDIGLNQAPIKMGNDIQVVGSLDNVPFTLPSQHPIKVLRESAVRDFFLENIKGTGRERSYLQAIKVLFNLPDLGLPQTSKTETVGAAPAIFDSNELIEKTLGTYVGGQELAHIISTGKWSYDSITGAATMTASGIAKQITKAKNWLTRNNTSGIARVHDSSFFQGQFNITDRTGRKDNITWSRSESGVVTSLAYNQNGNWEYWLMLPDNRTLETPGGRYIMTYSKGSDTLTVQFLPFDELLRGDHLRNKVMESYMTAMLQAGSIKEKQKPPRKLSTIIKSLGGLRPSVWDPQTGYGTKEEENNYPAELGFKNVRGERRNLASYITVNDPARAHDMEEMANILIEQKYIPPAPPSYQGDVAQYLFDTIVKGMKEKQAVTIEQIEQNITEAEAEAESGYDLMSEEALTAEREWDDFVSATLNRIDEIDSELQQGIEELDDTTRHYLVLEKEGLLDQIQNKETFGQIKANENVTTDDVFVLEDNDTPIQPEGTDMLGEAISKEEVNRSRVMGVEEYVQPSPENLATLDKLVAKLITDNPVINSYPKLEMALKTGKYGAIFNQALSKYGPDIWRQAYERFSKGTGSGQTIPGTTGGKGNKGRPGIIIPGGGSIPKARPVETYAKYPGLENAVDDYQKIAINLIGRSQENGGKAFLLADGTGVGKTRELLVAARMLADRAEEAAKAGGPGTRNFPGPVLIVTPNKLVQGFFEKELKAMNLPQTNILLVTYDGLLSKHNFEESISGLSDAEKQRKRNEKAKTTANQLIPIDLANTVFAARIADESHRLKNVESKRSNLFDGINADYSVFATATPMDKPTGATYYLSQITGLTEKEVEKMLGYTVSALPDADGKIKKFAVLNAGMTWPKVWDNIIALRNAAISQGSMIRREYPFYGTIENEAVILAPEDKAEIDLIDEAFGLNNWIGEDGKPFKYKNPVNGQLRENTYRAEHAKFNVIWERIQKELAPRADGKRPKIVIVAEGADVAHLAGLSPERIPTAVIYAPVTRDQLLPLLSKKMESLNIPHAKIYGKGDKSSAVDSFQNDPNCRVALMTPASGGVGISLDDQVGNEPRIMLVATLNYAGDQFDQTIGRVSRRNSKSPATVVFYRADEAFSDYKRGVILQRKLETLRRIQYGTDIDQAIGFNPDGDSFVSEEAAGHALDEAITYSDAALMRAAINYYNPYMTKNEAQFAADVVVDDMGRLFAIEGVTPEIIEVYRAITANMIQSGYYTMNGKTFNSIEELVGMSQPFRNPQYESARFIYTKSLPDGRTQVLGMETLTSYVPNCTPALNVEVRQFEEVIKRMRAAGADGFYQMHNHPSGHADASEADMRMDQRLNQLSQAYPDITYNGAYIIDSNEYTFVPGKDMSKIPKSYKGKKMTGWIGKQDFKHSFKFHDIDPLIQSSIDKTGETEYGSLADLRNGVFYSQDGLLNAFRTANNRENKGIVVFVDIRGTVRAVHDIPISMLEDKDKMVNYIRGHARANGATEAYLNININRDTFGDQRADLVHRNATDLFINRILSDAFTMSKSGGTETMWTMGERLSKSQQTTLRRNMKETLKQGLWFGQEAYALGIDMMLREDAYDPLDKKKVYKVERSMEIKDWLRNERKDLTNDNPSGTILNEILQNSIDATRGQKDRIFLTSLNTLTSGNPEFDRLQAERPDVFGNAKTVSKVVFYDNGHGMGPEDISSKLLKISGTNKGAADIGGFGKANVAIVNGANYIRIDTVFDRAKREKQLRDAGMSAKEIARETSESDGSPTPDGIISSINMAPEDIPIKGSGDKGPDVTVRKTKNPGFMAEAVDLMNRSKEHFETQGDALYYYDDFISGTTDIDGGTRIALYFIEESTNPADVLYPAWQGQSETGYNIHTAMKDDYEDNFHIDGFKMMRMNNSNARYIRTEGWTDVQSKYNTTTLDDGKGNIVEVKYKPVNKYGSPQNEAYRIRTRFFIKGLQLPNVMTNELQFLSDKQPDFVVSVNFKQTVASQDTANYPLRDNRTKLTEEWQNLLKDSIGQDLAARLRNDRDERFTRMGEQFQRSPIVGPNMDIVCHVPFKEHYDEVMALVTGNKDVFDALATIFDEFNATVKRVIPSMNLPEMFFTLDSGVHGFNTTNMDPKYGIKSGVAINPFSMGTNFLKDIKSNDIYGFGSLTDDEIRSSVYAMVLIHELAHMAGSVSGRIIQGHGEAWGIRFSNLAARFGGLEFRKLERRINSVFKNFSDRFDSIANDLEKFEVDDTGRQDYSSDFRKEGQESGIEGILGWSKGDSIVRDGKEEELNNLEVATLVARVNETLNRGNSAILTLPYLTELGRRAFTGQTYADWAAQMRGALGENFSDVRPQMMPLFSELRKNIPAIKDKVADKEAGDIQRFLDETNKMIQSMKDTAKQYADYKGNKKYREQMDKAVAANGENIGWFKKYFYLPFYKALSGSTLWKRAVGVMERRVEARQEKNHAYLSSLDSFLSMKGDKVARLEKAFIEGDRELPQRKQDLKKQYKEALKAGEYGMAAELKEQLDELELLRGYGDKELRERFKLTEMDIDTYRHVRSTLDTIHKDWFKSILDMTLRPYKNEPWFNLLNEVAYGGVNQKYLIGFIRSAGKPKLRTKYEELLKAWIKSEIPGIDDTIVNEYFNNIISAYSFMAHGLSQIRKIRNSLGRWIAYFPHVREGKYYVEAFVEDMDENGKTKKRKVWNEQFASLVESKQVYDRLVKEYGADNVDMNKVTKPADATFYGVRDENMLRLLGNAIERMKAKDDLKENELNVIKQEILNNLVNELKARGFGRFGIKRKSPNIMGYKETGLQGVLKDYVTGFTGMVTKQEAAHEFLDLLKDVPKKSDALYEDLSTYMRDMLRNYDKGDKISAVARSFMFTYYLAGSIRPIVLQLTQNFVTGMPFLQKELRALGIAKVGTAEKLYSIAMKDIGMSKVNKKDYSIKGDHLSDLEKRFIQEMLIKGVAQDQWIKELEGRMQSVLGEKYNRTIQILGMPFSAMEIFNRKSAGLAMFRVYMEHLKNEPNVEKRYQLSMEKAKEYIYNTHYMMGRENLPRYAAGGDITSQSIHTLMTFKSFNYNYVNSMITAGDWKVWAHSLAYLFLFGGLLALPFLKDILELITKTTGYNPVAAVKKQLRAVGGNTLERMGVHGIPTLLGISVTGSLAMGVPFVGESPSDTVTGAVGGIVKKVALAGKYASTGQFERATESMAPEFIASMMKAARMTTDAATTAHGKLIPGPDGKPMKLSASEGITRGAGFQPIRYAENMEDERNVQNIEQFFREKREKVFDEFRIARHNKDKEAMKEVLGDVKNFNDMRRDRGVQLIVAPLKMSSLIKNSREVMTKAERNKERYKTKAGGER
jgi:hypothetical protein